MLSTVVRRKHLICSLIFGTVLISFFQHILFPKYVSQGSLIIRTDSNSPLLKVFGKITGSASDFYNIEKAPSDEMMKILRANEFGAFISNKVKNDINAKIFPKNIIDYLYSQNNNKKISTNQIADFISGHYSIKQFDDIISISGYSSDAVVSEEIARWLTQTARLYLIDYETKEVLETEKYLKDEIALTNQRIADLNHKVYEYSKDPSVISSLGQSNSIEVNIARIREELEKVRVRTSEIEILENDFKDKIETDRMPANISTEVLYQMRGRVIDNLKDLSAEQLELSAKEKALASRLSQLVTSLRPDKEQAIFDIKKQLDLEHALRQELLRQVYATRIYQISSENKIRVYENTNSGSAQPVVTLSKKLMLSIVFAMVIAFVFMFAWEQLYPVMSMKHDFLQNGVRYLGSVPVLFNNYFNSSKASSSKSMFQRMSALLHSGVRTPESTSIQFLAARIIHVLEKTNNKRKGIISVISTNSGEGKTLISNCLSVAIGEFGARVLLIEGDILRSKGDNMFGISPGHGFSEVLSGKINLKDAVQTTEFKNVSYLRRGLVQPEASLLQSDKFEELLKHASGKFDVILIDTPALAAGPEALFLTGQSDMQLLVAAAHETKQEDFSELVESLRSRGLKSIYALLNRSSQRASTTEAYYYNEQLSDIKDKAA